MAFFHSILQLIEAMNVIQAKQADSMGEGVAFADEDTKEKV